MSEITNESVSLVVTSPPYPMIEMWDEEWIEQDPLIENALELNMGKEAFERMHKVLDSVWEEVSRVVFDSGIVCVNVGDATRKLGANFQCYPNAARITDWFFKNGFTVLPPIHWRKPTNKANKYMGSGMLPPSAYVTQEQEYILIFRKGFVPRRFDNHTEVLNRRESAYFYEERNKWFSDQWTDIPGSRQDGMAGSKLTRHMAVFPFDIPYRLINMYSVYGETVLDPFAGSGTTLIAAMASGRNSIGYDNQPDMMGQFEKKKFDSKTLNNRYIKNRIHKHIKYIEEVGELKYEAENYNFTVTNKGERDIQFYELTKLTGEEGTYEVLYEPYVKTTLKA